LRNPPGSAVPVPRRNFVASRVSLASAKSRKSSCCSVPQSCPILIVKGTKPCILSVLIVGCASVGELSVVSAASAAYETTTPSDCTPRHSTTAIVVTVIAATRARCAVDHARHGERVRYFCPRIKEGVWVARSWEAEQ
jgi:hypothetical protein